MDEPQTINEVSASIDEVDDALAVTEASSEAIEAGGAPDRMARRGGAPRWILQFAIGAVVAGGLVFGFGKRAELSSFAALTRAREDMRSGRSYQAARSLEAAHKEDPESRALRVALIEAYYRVGEPERARSLVNQVVLTPEEEGRIQPLVKKLESAGQTLPQAVELLRERQWAQALPLLQRAAKEMPDAPVAHVHLAQAYGALYITRQKPEDLQGYQAAQRRLTEINPTQAEEVKKLLGPIEVLPQVIRHTNAADAALKAGKTEAAMPELEAADRLYPNSAMVHALRAIAHAQRFEKTGDVQEKQQALEEFRTAVLLNPARAAMRTRLGKLAQEAAAE
jgi:tetratricopeptide (TPR) repeat protein